VADLLLDGLALLVTDGPAAAAPALREAISAFADPDIPVADRLRWSWWVPVASLQLWDREGYRLIVPPLQLARNLGELDQLPMLLNMLAVATTLRGDLAAAAVLIAEADAAREATAARLVSYAAMVLAAFRGSKAEAVPLIEATLEQAASVGQGAAVTWAHWVTAVLHNGLGRYQEALVPARQAAGHRLAYLSMWALPELVVAAARTGNTALARDALDQLSEWTQAGQTDWGLGVEARSRALLSEGEAADRLYLEAIDRLGRTGLRPDLARAHLHYGEWLRRQRRRGEARVHLRTAHGLLDAMGMEGFAARARHELRATGETARRRSVATVPQLTAQEAHIARLARDGLSNPEIAARLFLSPRTVQYHLGKVFIKLDITSRSDLRRILPADQDDALLR
jgi:DNA-binding CsgD family transcriptional regulator